MDPPPSQTKVSFLIAHPNYVGISDLPKLSNKYKLVVGLLYSLTIDRSGGKVKWHAYPRLEREHLEQYFTYAI
jgi:hypothetical protein